MSAFLVIRLLHGLSTGFRPTGTSAFLTDLVPIERRGEALGYLGVAGNAGMALGPSLGSWLAVDFGYDAMFAASSLLGVASYIMTRKLPETLPNARPVSKQDLNVFQGGTVEPAAWPAALFLLPVAVAFGTFLTVTPDLVEGLGFVYKGSFNTIVVIASIAMRLVAGKASDKYGRPQLLLVGAALGAGHVVVFRIDHGACAGGRGDCVRHVRGHQHAGDFCVDGGFGAGREGGHCLGHHADGVGGGHWRGGLCQWIVVRV